MEQRLSNKINALEGAVQTNERHIQILTSSVNGQASDIADLRRRVEQNEHRLDRFYSQSLSLLDPASSSSVLQTTEAGGCSREELRPRYPGTGPAVVH